MKGLDMQQFHIYGQNVYEYFVSEDLQEVIKWFDKQKLVYSLYLVPVPKNANYEIEFYVPQVKGVQYLGSFKNKKLVD